MEIDENLAYGISGLIAFAGLTVGGIIAYMSDGAVSAMRLAEQAGRAGAKLALRGRTPGQA